MQNLSIAQPSRQLHAQPCVIEWAKTFNQDFSSYQVKLQPGANEPFYQASQQQEWAIIYSSFDYFSSALHELAHWCVAGAERRKQDDYGYWYAPDGRSIEQQRLFYQVEIKPQAIEWAFSLAAGIAFQVSLDNLNNQLLDSEHKDIEQFKQNLHNQLEDYFSGGFPPRALAIIQALCTKYRGGLPIQMPKVTDCA